MPYFNVLIQPLQIQVRKSCTGGLGMQGKQGVAGGEYEQDRAGGEYEGWREHMCLVPLAGPPIGCDIPDGWGGDIPDGASAEHASMARCGGLVEQGDARASWTQLVAQGPFPPPLWDRWMKSSWWTP